MNKRGDAATTIVSIILVVGLIIFLVFNYYSPGNEIISHNYTENSQSEIRIANWNLKIFGDSKAEDTQLLLSYVRIMNDYDIVFVQEIRDKDGSAFNRLCLMMPDKSCKVSSRAGRSTSKEQYGIIYDKDIEVMDLVDYNPDDQDRWERPPVKVTFNNSGYIFSIYNIHTKPSDVPNEMEGLVEVVENSGNVIVMGDLNADCDYYKNNKEDDFDTWNWLVRDKDDTTVGSTDCAYDRIILNDDAFDEYVDYEIRSNDITDKMSDHYLVSVTLKNGDNE